MHVKYICNNWSIIQGKRKKGKIGFGNWYTSISHVRITQGHVRSTCDQYLCTLRHGVNHTWQWKSIQLFFFNRSKMAFFRLVSILSVFLRCRSSLWLAGMLSKMAVMLYSSSDWLRKSPFLLLMAQSTSSFTNGGSWTIKFRTHILVRFKRDILNR